MAALHGSRGVMLSVKTHPPQTWSCQDGVMSQTNFILPNCGTKQSYDLRNMWKHNSIVHAKKGRHLPKVCQKTPRLRAVFLKDHTFHSPDVSRSLPAIAPTTPTPASPDHVALFNYMSTTVENDHQALYSSKSFSTSTSDLTLLRKPTYVPAIPVMSRDVQLLANSADLKPLIIDDSLEETSRFYDTHFPLLLKRKFEGETELIITKRCVTPPNNAEILLKRGKDVSRRLVNLDKQLEVLEREMDYGIFVTELRNEIFDPTKWSWNTTRYFHQQL